MITELSLLKFILSFIAIMLSIIFVVAGFVNKTPKLKRRGAWLFVGTVFFLVLTTTIEFVYYGYFMKHKKMFLTNK